MGSVVCTYNAHVRNQMECHFNCTTSINVTHTRFRYHEFVLVHIKRVKRPQALAAYQRWRGAFFKRSAQKSDSHSAVHSQSTYLITVVNHVI